ncbi:hypothetical protein B296_00022495 [Ensete ventricosum]|uniref:Uncharacterized protein n=1 Tax=Ensete ventricosum TaxID=4639 RepID=A0A426ZAX1_ENSVE|nr:hypothetical protein B296_00022495 [Ensete ventricosum]
MRLRTRLECVRSSRRVSGAYQDGAREFAGRRLRLVGRLSRVAEWLARTTALDFKQLSVAEPSRPAAEPPVPKIFEYV